MSKKKIFVIKSVIKSSCFDINGRISFEMNAELKNH